MLRTPSEEVSPPSEDRSPSLDLPAAPRRGAGCWLGTALALLGLALAAALYVLAQPPQIPSITLADGATATLETVTLGSQTQVRGSTLQQLLHRVLPDEWRGKLGVREFIPGPQAGLTFWVTRKSMPGEYRATAFDEHGNEVDAEFSQWMGDHERWEFRVFPRRSRTIGLRLYRLKSTPGQFESTWTRMGEFVTRNPAFGEHPRWSASSLPVTARSGDLELSVSRLATGGQPEGMSFSRKPSEVYAETRFKVTRNGKPATDWDATLDQLSDATGNTWRANGTGFFDRGDERQLWFATSPWPDENAWKLRFQLSRTASAPFTAQELWKLEALPFPGKGQAHTLHRKATVNGMSLELVGLYGPGAAYPNGYHFSGHETGPVLVLRVPSPQPAGVIRTLVKAQDERGRSVDLHFSASFSDARETRELYRVILPAGASSAPQRLSVTYAVQKVHYTELIMHKTSAKPSLKP